MRFALTALAMLGGILFTAVGLGFFFQPQSTGASFALLPDGIPGLAVMRADMTAFFVVGGCCMIWGAWKRNGELLLVPAALFGIAFVGRLVTALDTGRPSVLSPQAASSTSGASIIRIRNAHHPLGPLPDGASLDRQCG